MNSGQSPRWVRPQMEPQMERPLSPEYFPDKASRSRSRSPPQNRRQSRSRSRSRSRSQSPSYNTPWEVSQSPPWDPTTRPSRPPYIPDYTTLTFLNRIKEIETAVSGVLKWEGGLSRIVALMALPHFTPDWLCGRSCYCDVYDGHHIDYCDDGEPQWNIQGLCLGCDVHILHHN